MKISFSTREFEGEYGRAPKGRGWWLFLFEGYEFWANGTYADAKRACRKRVKELAPKGFKDTVYVTVGC